MSGFKKKLTLFVAATMSFGALVCLSNQKILDTVHAQETQSEGTTDNPNVRKGTIMFNQMDYFSITDTKDPHFWGSSYSKRESTFDGFGTGDIKVVLGGASKQTGTITDAPVIKEAASTISLTDAYFQSLTFTFKEWSTKKRIDMSFTSGTTELGKITKFQEVVNIEFPTDQQLSEITFKNSYKDQLGLVSVDYVIHNNQPDDGVVRHNVTFKDGDKVLSSEVIEDGKLVTKPTDPVKDGASFEGWFNEPTFETEFDFTKPINATTVAYAKFKEAPYKLNSAFEKNKSYLITGEVVGRIKSDQIMVQDDTGAILINDPKVNELTIGQEISLKGKYTEPKGGIPNFTSVTELNVLTTDEYTIIPITDLTQVTKDNVSKYVELNNLVVESVDTSIAYKKIKLKEQNFLVTLHETNLANITGFTSFDDIKPGTVLNVKGAINVHGNDIQVFPNELSYEVKYTVSFNTNGGSEVPNQELGKDSKVTLPTANPTKEGYEFTGWFTDEACTEAFDAETIITADTTLYAGWKDIRPTLTLGEVPATIKVGSKTTLTATTTNITNPEIIWEVTEGSDLVTLSTATVEGNVSSQEITAVKEGIVKLQAKVTIEGSATPITKEATIEIKHDIRDVQINPMANLGLSFIRNAEDGIIASTMSVATVNKSFNWTDSEGVKFLEHVTANEGVVDLTEQFLLEEQRNRLSVEYKQNTAEHAYLTSKEIRLYQGATLEFTGLNGLKISSVDITFGKKINGITLTSGEFNQEVTTTNTTVNFAEGVSGFVLESTGTSSIASIDITYEKPGKVNKYTDVRLGYRFSLPTTFTNSYEVTKAGVKVMNGETLVKDIEATVDADTYTAILDHITDENLSTRFEAIPYVVIDGVTYELDSINYSVEDMVDAYLLMDDLDGTLNPIVKDLKNHINQTR